MSGAADGKAPAILIVEDEWLIAGMISSALQRAGYRTIGPAATNADACRLIGQNPIDCAILDVNLGGERSFVALDRLLECGTPYLLLTGYSVSDLPEVYRKGLILGKPVVQAVLVQSIEQLMTEHARRKVTDIRPVA